MRIKQSHVITIFIVLCATYGYLLFHSYFVNELERNQIVKAARRAAVHVWSDWTTNKDTALLLSKGKTTVRNAGSLCLDDLYVDDLANLSQATFMTLLSDSWNLNYLRGALIWCYRMRNLHRNPSVSITIAIDNATLNDYGGRPIIKAFTFLGATDIKVIGLLHNPRAKKKAWQNIFSKLLLFNPNLTRFSQIAYFDADNYPLRPMYELFAMPCNYLLGAANGLAEHPDINAGVLIIRPHQGIYDTLISIYNANIQSWLPSTYSRTEQALINDLFTGAGRTPERNTFWYRFPYEYNSPWWQNGKHWRRPGGIKAMKNVHNKLWGHKKKETPGEKEWNQSWNEVWTLLKDNHLTDDILDLDICNSLSGLSSICTKDNVTHLMDNP